MEEEGARRRAYKGRGGAGLAGLLAGLNEDDEDELDDSVIVPSQPQGQQKQPPPHELYDGRAGQRDIPRRHGKPFDLSIGEATLLGRRRGGIPTDLSPLAKNAAKADTIDAPQSPMHY